MSKGLKRPQVFRVCAVCGKRHGVTHGFGTILSRNGIKGSKATKECVRKLAEQPKPQSMTIDKTAIEADRQAGRNTAEDGVCPICHGFGDDEDTRATCPGCGGEGTRAAYDAGR